jgi:hypothetical protein
MKNSLDVRQPVDVRSIETGVLNICRCPRCGSDHQIVVRQFLNPVRTGDGEPFTRWSLCPLTGEPLMIFESKWQGDIAIIGAKVSKKARRDRV